MIHHHKLRDSLRYAWAGIVYSFKNNQNFRIHFIVAFFVIAAAIILHVTPFEMGILGITILFVIGVEMINSAIEEMVDLITQEHRAQAKIAKDVAAGMVLIASFGSAIIGGLIFLPYILRLFFFSR